MVVHIFARRETRFAGQPGYEERRGKVAKDADRCGILLKGQNGGFFALGTEVKVLRASGRARLGTTRNLV